MTQMKLRSALLLTTSLLMIGCDQKKDETAASQNGTADDVASYYAQYNMDAPPATLSGSYLVGQFAQSQSDWTTASDYFAKVIDFTPNSPDIQRRVMALDMGSGHYDKAITMARSIIADKKGDATLAHLLSALANFKDGKYDVSLKEIQGYSNDGLGVAILPLLKVWAEAGEGKTDITALKDSPSLLYQAVLVAAYTKDKAAIAKLAKDYDFTRTPTPIKRLEDIATIFSIYGQKDEAQSIYNALKAAMPNRTAYYDAKIQTTDGNASQPSLKNIDTPQIALSESLLDMARLLNNGYEDSARLFAHMAIYLNADNNSALELLAQISSDNGLYNEAVTYLSRIDTKGDVEKQIQIERQTAQLKVRAGQPDEAIRILSNLVSAQKNVDAQIQIGDIYRNEEKFKDALRAYDQAFDMLNDKITAPYWDLSFARGMTNERLKNWDQAEKDLQTALMYEPDQPYVLNYLGYSWADQGKNIEKAAEMIEKAARLKPDDGAIIDSLGWVYFRMGQFDKAVTTLEKAVELAPTEPEINDHLGDAYWRVGRKSEARFQWRRASSFSKDDTTTAKILAKVDAGLPELQQSTPPAKLADGQK